MPFSPRTDYNQYRREWRARQRFKLQGIAPVAPDAGRSMNAPFDGSASVIRESLTPVPGKIEPVHPPVLHRTLCWACGGTGFSSGSTRCPYCNTRKIATLFSFSKTKEPVAPAEESYPLGVVLRITLCAAGTVFVLWLLKKSFGGAQSAAAEVAELVYEPWGPGLAARIRESLPGGGL